MSDIPKLYAVRPYIPKRKRKDPEPTSSQIPTKRPYYFDKEIFLANEIIYENSQLKKPNIPPRNVWKSTKVNHAGPLWRVEWCVKHSHLLACVGGNAIKLYDCMKDLKDVWTSNEVAAQIKDIAWSRTCKQILACDFSKTVKEFDFLSNGAEKSSINIPEIPSVLRYWPDDDNVIIVGGQNSFLSSYDLRSRKCITTYGVEFGNILDLSILPGTGYFVTSTDAVSRESASHSVVVWDFETGAKVSDQIFHEKYTCPKLCVHPSGSCFLAQTNGDYIARFSTHPPYKLDKYVRYEKHKVDGFPAGLDISSDGKIVASGSSDGSVCFYKFKDSALLSRIHTNKGSFRNDAKDGKAIVTVQYHPVMSSMVAAGDWSGNLHILE